jgi:hypothetical protein
VCPQRFAFVAILWAGLAAVFVPSFANAQPNFLIPLPQKGIPRALNNSGQVLYDTGLLTGNNFAAFPAGFTIDPETPGILGDSGVVAGAVPPGHLAIYNAGAVTDLGLPSWSQSATPTAINASGHIVGLSPGSFVTSGFLYSGGTFSPITIDLGDLTSGFEPIALNDSGEIAITGASDVPGWGCHGFVITGEVLTDLGPHCPTAMNASGQITGSVTSDQVWHAFIWAGGTATSLVEPAPYTNSQGQAINNGGQIVGFMGNAQSSAPFFYNGVMIDINSLVSASDPLKSTVTIGSVVTINDSRLLLVLSTVPVVGSRTAYLLQAPWLDVAPGPLTFANQSVGSTSAPQAVTLTNSGTVRLPLDSISIATGATEFSQTNACPSSLAAGANCTVSITFTPSAAAIKNAALNVVTGGATIAVPLSGLTPITISLSATPSSPMVGHPFVITWAATLASDCQSSGGTASDGWVASTTSGSVSVLEAAAGAYTYKLTCSVDGVSAVQSLNVTVADPASGGTGAVDFGSLLVLAGVLVLHYRKKLN